MQSTSCRPPQTYDKMNLEGGLNNQQMAEDLLAHANEANKRTFCPQGRVPPTTQVGGGAEPDGDERERQKNDFFHARFILRAMTEDR